MAGPVDHEEASTDPDVETRPTPGVVAELPSPFGVRRRTWLIIGVWMLAVIAFFILVGYLGAINF